MELYQIIFEKCNQILRQHHRVHGNPRSTVLEAGGGSFSHFWLPEGSKLIALDISLGQLLRNQSTSTKVQADLHHLPIRPHSLGMVVCFNVIEHLDDPEAALTQLIASLARGGILLVGCPNRESLKGLLTRFMPLWLHRLYYRFIVGKKDRGEGHFDVFARPFKRLVSSRILPNWLGAQNMEILYHKVYDGAAAYQLTTGGLKTRLAGIPYYTLAAMMYFISGGHCGGTDSDILLIARNR